MTEVTAAQLATLPDRIPRGVRVLSLDCFDTIVWRRVAAPHDVFFTLQSSPVWRAHGIRAYHRTQGEAAARARARDLDSHSFALTLCSPLERARRTAELAGVTPDAIDPDLLEWDYGAWEGRTTAEIREELGEPDWTIVPAMMQAQARRDQAFADLKRSRADGLPTISLGAGGGDTNNFAPRLSLNYRPDARSSLRFGAGVFTGKLSYSVISDALQRNTTAPGFLTQLGALQGLGLIGNDLPSLADWKEMAHSGLFKREES